MLQYAEKQTKRPVVSAQPFTTVNRAELRAEINKRFSKTLDDLAR